MYKIILFDLEKYKFQIRHDKTDAIIANSVDFDTAEERDEIAQIMAGVIDCDIYTLSLKKVNPKYVAPKDKFDDNGDLMYHRTQML